MSNGKYMSGRDFKKMIFSAMRTAHISALVDPSGQLREYSFLMPGGEMAMLSWESFDAESEYIIEINGHEIISVVIPKGRKIFSDEEQMVLDIFRVCAAQVILQEQVMLHLHKNSKTYS